MLRRSLRLGVRERRLRLPGRRGRPRATATRDARAVQRADRRRGQRAARGRLGRPRATGCRPSGSASRRPGCCWPTDPEGRAAQLRRPRASRRASPTTAARSTPASARSSTSAVAEDLTLPADAVYYVGHWITPEGPPRRYDTRFFVDARPGRSGRPCTTTSRPSTTCGWHRPRRWPSTRPARSRCCSRRSGTSACSTDSPATGELVASVSALGAVPTIRAGAGRGRATGAAVVVPVDPSEVRRRRRRGLRMARAAAPGPRTRRWSGRPSWSGEPVEVAPGVVRLTAAEPRADDRARDQHLSRRVAARSR